MSKREVTYGLLYEQVMGYIDECEARLESLNRELEHAEGMPELWLRDMIGQVTREKEKWIETLREFEVCAPLIAQMNYKH